MQLTLCVVTGFIALSAASPAAPIIKQSPAKSSSKAATPQSTGLGTSRNVSVMKGECSPCGGNSDHCHACHFECEDCDHLLCTPSGVPSAPSSNFCIDLHALPLHVANGTAASSKGTVASLFFRTIGGSSGQPRGYGDNYQGPPETYYGSHCPPGAPCPPGPVYPPGSSYPPGPYNPYDSPPCSPDGPCPPGPPGWYDGPSCPPGAPCPPGPPDSYNGPPCPPGAPCPPNPSNSYTGPPCPSGVPCPPGPTESYSGPPCLPGGPCPPSPPDSYTGPPCAPGDACPPGPPCPAGSSCPPSPPDSYSGPPCAYGDSCTSCPAGAPCPPGPPETYTGPPCSAGAPCPPGSYQAPPKRGHYNGSTYGYPGTSHGRPYTGPSILPPISNGPVPYFEFNEDDCIVCTDQNPCIGNCTWQFDCSNRFTCFYNNAHEVVELCYEQRENCS